MPDPYDREIAALERELDETHDPKEQAALRSAIRDVEREASEEERWLDEGLENGWL